MEHEIIYEEPLSRAVDKVSRAGGHVESSPVGLLLCQLCNSLCPFSLLLQPEIQTVRQSDSQTVRKSDSQTVKKSGSQTVRQSDGQIVRQSESESQTVRQSDIQDSVQYSCPVLPSSTDLL